MAYSYRCGPTAALSNRTSWGPVSSPSVDPKTFERPLSGNYDRIFNAFERTNAFQYVRNTFEQTKEEDRHMGSADVVVNRKMSSSFERADCSLAAQSPALEDEDFYREKILYSQARQLFPLQEDLADWINKTIGISYLSGENFLDVLDNGVELCQLAATIHDRARDALDNGLLVGPVPQIRGRCWQRAARRSFFSRDNTENFLTFCRELGVHENLLFESDDLVLHNQPRQVILCLLEVARLATRYGVEPPGLVQLEKEIAAEERDSGLHSALSDAAWQFRDSSPEPMREKSIAAPPPSSPEPDDRNASSGVEDTDDAKSEGTVDSSDSDVPLKPTNELDKRVQLVTRLMERGCSCGAGRCSKLLKVKKVGEGRYNIAGRNVFIRLLKGRHMMVRVGGGWDTLEHFLSRHEPCQVRLVTQGRRGGALLPLPPPPAPLSPAASTGKLSPTPSSGKLSPAPSSGKLSPISKASSGKISPVDRNLTRSSTVSPVQSSRASTTSPVSRKTSSGKSSPLDNRRTSTPKPSTAKQRSALTLPLKEADKVRPRKQSAPAGFSPRTPPEPRPALNQPKKSRSMSLAPSETKFCGSERLNKARSLAATPTDTPRKTRSQSVVTAPVTDAKKSFCGTDKLNTMAKKTRSASLATTPVGFRPLNKSVSATLPGVTQAAIEESIRLSLAASIADESSKPFLHIKAKYRSPPPREVPPR